MTRLYVGAYCAAMIRPWWIKWDKREVCTQLKRKYESYACGYIQLTRDDLGDFCEHCFLDEGEVSLVSKVVGEEAHLHDL